MEDGFLSILGWITQITTLIIMAVIGLKSIADVMRSAGFLSAISAKIEDKLYAGERRRFKQFMVQLGVFPRKVKAYRSMTQLLDSPLPGSMTTKEIEKRLDRIAKNNVTRDDYIISDVSRLEVGNFVNLRQAFCISGCDKELSMMMASLIHNRMKEDQFHFDAIVSRKNALDLLGYLVAKRLRVPFILYNDNRSILVKRENTGREVVTKEYPVPDVKSAIMVDDSCVSGNSMVEMAHSLRNQKIEVNHAFVFFIRGEDEVSPVLKLENYDLKLHYVTEYDDDDISNLRTGVQEETATQPTSDESKIN